MAQKQVTPKQQPEANQDDKLYVYIGPSLRGIVTFGECYHGTADEIQEKVRTLAKIVPEARMLVVPVEQLAVSRKETETPGRALYHAYHAVLNSKKEK